MDTEFNKSTIRIRACVAIVQDDRLLLVPHYDTDAGPVQWHLPGGAISFGEPLRAAAAREVAEETGFVVRVDELIDVSEVIAPERKWHSVTVTFSGTVTGGSLRSEPNHVRGDKTPAWFSADEVSRVPHHPSEPIRAVLDQLRMMRGTTRL